MGGSLGVWTAAGRELVAWEAGRLTLGADPANDLPLAADSTLSRLHAVLERYEAGWGVRDLGSRNGTFVNGQRIWSERPLRPGDGVRGGGTRRGAGRPPPARPPARPSGVGGRRPRQARGRRTCPAASVRSWWCCAG